MKPLSNKEIAYILYELSVFYDMKSVPFKPMAYERAAEAVESVQESLKDIYREGGKKALMGIEGVGEGIADHIEELLKTGHFGEYEKLKKEFPIKIRELAAIPGVGAKTIKTLWQKLRVKDVDDLEKAAKEGLLAKIKGFGAKTQEKILDGIAFMRSSGGRRLLGDILPETRRLEEQIGKFPGVSEAMVCGSIRRRKETIGDIDIIVTSTKPEEVMRAFLMLPEIEHVYGTGKTKTNARFHNGLDVDIRVVPKRALGAALNYFTGSKAHNIALREIAQKKGWKLNEYGLFAEGGERETDAELKKTQNHPSSRAELATGRSAEKKQTWRFIGGKTEKELYEKLGLSYIEPELREMAGEIEAARDGKLPKIIGYDDLKGDLQTQTDWTDGAHSIEEMARAAAEAGLSYIVITDHTKSLAMTDGADEKKLRRQIKEIEKVNEGDRGQGTGFRVLKGAEVNIKKDGTLDIDDETLALLDCVGAAVHSHFNLSRKEQTERIIRACENPNVDIIFHLTGRLINRRKPIELDIDEVIAAAKRTGTVLEIDAFPDRLDLCDEYIRKCVNAGVKMSIDSDAHAVGHFSVLEYGIAQARRGWATKEDIINTLSAHDLLAEIKKPKKERWG
ncbi:MAG: DNA polymerase/3'-5' exonuclease PolX [Parcubacteria group bacterium]|nr:DNA polymerase/3'-5' exonuclease PolX [Parcubacteria group bacterium]